MLIVIVSYTYIHEALSQKSSASTLPELMTSHVATLVKRQIVLISDEECFTAPAWEKAIEEALEDSCPITLVETLSSNAKYQIDMFITYINYLHKPMITVTQIE